MRFIDMHFVTLVIVSVLWGLREQHIYNNGYQDRGTHWFGKLSPAYHGSLIVTWAAICWGFGYWWFTPAFMTIEDLSYFLFNKNDELDPDDWINFGLGGHYVFGKWLPNIYLVGLAASLLLYIIDVNAARWLQLIIGG